MGRDLDTLKKKLWEQFETASKQHDHAKYSSWGEADRQMQDVITRLAGQILAIETEQRIIKENNTGGVLKGLK